MTWETGSKPTERMAANSSTLRSDVKAPGCSPRRWSRSCARRGSCPRWSASTLAWLRASSSSCTRTGLCHQALERGSRLGTAGGVPAQVMAQLGDPGVKAHDFVLERDAADLVGDVRLEARASPGEL